MSLLSEKLAPIWSAINRLQARQMSIFPATVTSVDPVRIRIDGESQSLAASPDTLTHMTPGNRVRVLRYGTTHLVLGHIGGSGAMLLDDISLPTNDRAATLTIPPAFRGRFQKYEIHIKSGVTSTDSNSVRAVSVRPNGPGGDYRYNTLLRNSDGDVIEASGDASASIPRNAFLGAFSGLATLTFVPSERVRPSWMYFTGHGWTNSGTASGRLYQTGGRWSDTPQTITHFYILTVLAGANFADSPRAELWGYR